MVYRSKIEYVNAMRWDGSTLGKEMCVFLGGYIDGVVMAMGDNYYTDHNRVTGGLMIIGQDGVASPCMIGNYIVIGDDDVYKVMTAEEFEARYETIGLERIA